MAYTFFWWAVFSRSENLTLTNASRSKAAKPPVFAPPPRVFLAPPRVFLALPLADNSLPFFPRVFLIILDPVFLRVDLEAFFAGAGVFLEVPGLFFNLPVHRVGVFMVFFFARAALALAEEAGVFFAAFLILGLEVEAFLAPALAAFLEAAEFGGAILLTSDLFAGPRETVEKSS